MKPKCNPQVFVLFLIVVLSAMAVNAQTATPTAYHQKDFIGDNPTADRDLQTVSDYLNSLLVNGDVDKARSLVTKNFKTYGPGPNDSADLEKEINNWRENYKIHLDRKVNFVSQTFRVLSGDLQGDWVSVWGDYNCTIDSKKIRIPFQSTYHVMDDGKIDRVSSYFDMLSVMTNLGYKLIPPAQNTGKKKK